MKKYKLIIIIIILFLSYSIYSNKNYRFTFNSINEAKLLMTFSDFLKNIEYDKIIINEEGIWEIYLKNNKILEICDKNYGKDKIIKWFQIFSNKYVNEKGLCVGLKVDQLLNIYPSKYLYIEYETNSTYFDISKFSNSKSIVIVYVTFNNDINKKLIEKIPKYIIGKQIANFDKNGQIHSILIMSR